MSYTNTGASAPGSIPVSGTYVGTGSTQSFFLGFQPDLLQVWCISGQSSQRNGGVKSSQLSGNTTMAHDGLALSVGVTITSTGFTVDSGAQFNYSGYSYIYSATRG